MLRCCGLAELNVGQPEDSKDMKELSMLLTEDYFPGSIWLRGIRAKILFYRHGMQFLIFTKPISDPMNALLDVQGCVRQFERMLAKDPFRADEIAFISNVYYSTGLTDKFNSLTSDVLPNLDADRPEVCCAIANHWSMRGDHEKAVKYLKRATELDRTFYQAWTLMGHEYLELNHNTHAAIESYRRAIGELVDELERVEADS
jgi:anaphase-promoting complex subunit 8